MIAKRYHLSLPRLRTVLFATGITIQLIALLGEHATELPFILRMVVPSYYHASNAIGRLDSDSAVKISSSSEEGYAELSSLLARHTAKKLNQGTTQRISVSDINVHGSEFVDGKLATSIHWKFKLERPINHKGQISDNGTDSWSFEAIKSEVETLKGDNIVTFSIVLFLIGSALDIIAFRMENKPIGGGESA